MCSCSCHGESELFYFCRVVAKVLCLAPRSRLCILHIMFCLFIIGSVDSILENESLCLIFDIDG